MLFTLNSYSDVCQLFLSKTRKKSKNKSKWEDFVWQRTVGLTAGTQSLLKSNSKTLAKFLRKSETKEANCLRFKTMLGSQTLYEQKED